LPGRPRWPSGLCRCGDLPSRAYLSTKASITQHHALAAMRAGPKRSTFGESGGLLRLHPVRLDIAARRIPTLGLRDGARRIVGVQYLRYAADYRREEADHRPARARLRALDLFRCHCLPIDAEQIAIHAAHHSFHGDELVEEAVKPQPIAPVDRLERIVADRAVLKFLHDMPAPHIGRIGVRI